MAQLAQTSSPILAKSTLEYATPSSSEFSRHIAVKGQLSELSNFKISCKDKGGSQYDLSIDNKDSYLTQRKLENVAKVNLTRNSKGDSILSIERSKNFEGEIEIISPRGELYKLNAPEKISHLSLPSAPLISKEEIELKVEVPGLSAKPISKHDNAELFKQYEAFKKIGGEIVVVSDNKNGFTYQLRRGQQIVATIDPPSSREGFHTHRDNLLESQLTKLNLEDKSSINYKDKEISFSRMQSPELYEHSQRLSNLGINIKATTQEDGSLIINLEDKKTGYGGTQSLTISNEKFIAMARGQEHLSKELTLLLSSATHRTDLMHRSDGKTSQEFNTRVKKLAQDIPQQVVDILMEDNWSITAKNHIADGTILADKPEKARLPAGRCVPSEKDLQLAEFQTATQTKGQITSDPNNAIFHEVAHALFYKIKSQSTDSWQKVELDLKIALERDLNQLGDISLIKDKNDPELSEKLKYYGNLNEGFAESYEGMICPNSNGGKIMPKYFPNFFKACKQLVEDQKLL